MVLVSYFLNGIGWMESVAYFLLLGNLQGFLQYHGAATIVATSYVCLYQVF